jgi:membrane protein DedA with SNARE-associated domain
MQRLKASPGFPAPSPPGLWLAGILIGSAVMTLATSAMMLGAGAAIQDAAIRRRPGS